MGVAGGLFTLSKMPACNVQVCLRVAGVGVGGERMGGGLLCDLQLWAAVLCKMYEVGRQWLG